jgi:hypothetical protein
MTSRKPKMMRGTPRGSKKTVMLKTAPTMTMTKPKTMAMIRPVSLTIQVRNRQMAQKGHKYQGTCSAVVI